MGLAARENSHYNKSELVLPHRKFHFSNLSLPTSNFFSVRLYLYRIIKIKREAGREQPLGLLFCFVVKIYKGLTEELPGYIKRVI